MKKRVTVSKQQGMVVVFQPTSFMRSCQLNAFCQTPYMSHARPLVNDPDVLVVTFPHKLDLT